MSTAEVGNITTVSNAIKKDLEAQGKMVIPTKAYMKTDAYGFMIAIRTRITPAYAGPSGSEQYDYHVMGQDLEGQWFEQKGRDGDVIAWDAGITAEQADWAMTTGGEPNYYDGDQIVYFYVSR